ncbi:hypothetical protein CGZ80_13355 [Rhodopirellula sp. MGV]|nr:hypothetical protein CGZ80_13355 [Rhodopirellula sp. MGV]
MPNGVQKTIAMPSGMSGASVFRCRTASHAGQLVDSSSQSEELALKCWPEQTPGHRVEAIHQRVSSLASKLDLVPSYRRSVDGKTAVVDLRGCWWELSSWMPGQPLPANADIAQVTCGARALLAAHRHLCTIELGQDRHFQPPVFEPCVAVQERLKRLQTITQPLQRCFQSNLAGSVPVRQLTGTDPALVLQAIDRARELLRRNWPDRSRRIQAELATLQFDPVPQHWILRDVHREHLLFVDRQVSGLIDFDAMRIDSPIVDFARWLGSFDCFWESPFETATQILAEVEPDSPLTASPAIGDPPQFTEPPSSEPGTGRPTAPRDSSWGLDSPPATVRPPSTFRAIEEGKSIKLLMAIARASLWLSLGNWVVWLVDESRQFPDLSRVAERVGRLTDYASRDAEH